MNYRKDQIDFYHANVPIALDVEHALAIPRDATIIALAQVYIETAAQDLADKIWKPGLSELYLKANNPFGMRWYEKYHKGDPLPPWQTQTWEVINGKPVSVSGLFRHFESLREAYVAHWFLFKSAGYAPALRAIARGTAEKPGWANLAESLGPKTAATDSAHCGYSTNPSYSAELIKVVHQFRLDDPRMLDWYLTGKDPSPVAPVSPPANDGRRPPLQTAAGGDTRATAGRKELA